MQTIQQQNPSSLLILKSQDISKIIKHFSFTIQQRFQQIQKNHNNYFTCLNNSQSGYQKTQLENEILAKYSEYKTSNQQEIKLLEKFIERLLQVYDFFRIKTNDAEVLGYIAEKIEEKLKQIIKNEVNYHFFVNNRPKTHKSNARPLEKNNNIINSYNGQSNQANNSILSINNNLNSSNLNPHNLCTKSEFDVNSVFISNKKTKTQINQKKVVDVGKLFRYVFSILKRGYLMKLKMEKSDYKDRKNKLNKSSLGNNSNTKNNISQNTSISIQGTGAILRNYSQKIKQENNQNHMSSLLPNEFLLNKNNKKQIYLYRKIKNRSNSSSTTNTIINNSSTYSNLINSTNPTVLKNYNVSSTSTYKTTRDTQKQIAKIYDVLDIQRYYVLRISKTKLKQCQTWKKDQLRRNQGIQKERKKYLAEWERKTNKSNKVEEKQNQQEKYQNLLEMEENDGQNEGIQNQEGMNNYMNDGHIKIEDDNQDNQRYVNLYETEQNLSQKQQEQQEQLENQTNKNVTYSNFDLYNQRLLQQNHQSSVILQEQAQQNNQSQLYQRQDTMLNEQLQNQLLQISQLKKPQSLLIKENNQNHKTNPVFRKKSISMKIKTEENCHQNDSNDYKLPFFKSLLKCQSVEMGCVERQNEENKENPKSYKNETHCQTLVIQSSRSQKQRENREHRILMDKTSNLMDKSNVNNDEYNCVYKPKSLKQSRKQLRLNLPKMFGQKSNSNRGSTNIQEKTNQGKSQQFGCLDLSKQKIAQSIQNKKRNIQKISQKSQKYLLENYSMDTYDNDNLFVPLLPKKQDQIYSRTKDSAQNQQKYQGKRKKAVSSNLHPLNRCRAFRQNEKKLLAPKNSGIFKTKDVLVDVVSFTNHENVRKAIL